MALFSSDRLERPLETQTGRVSARPNEGRETVGGPREGRLDEERRAPRARLLLLLAPLVCCGGPLILAGLATASAATLGAVGAVVGLGLVGVGAALWVRRRRRMESACCPLAKEI
ncbi:MAG: hypothetical protein ACP5P1_15895 [Acidimicrobiales bacterium]